MSAASLESDDPEEIISAKGLTITYRPSDYPTELRRYNPTEELDAIFLFADTPHTEAARMSILARTNCLVPEDEEGSLRRLERAPPKPPQAKVVEAVSDAGTCPSRSIRRRDGSPQSKPRD